MLLVEDLTVRYGDSSTNALERVYLEMSEWKLSAVLGSNGAGKTTLLRAVAGALSAVDGKITSGSMTSDGHDLSGRSLTWRVKHGIVLCPEDRGMFGTLTVMDNLKLSSYVLPHRFREQRREEALELFPELKPRLNDAASLLSGGQQQLLALARCFVMDPTLLLLDEPSLGLAPKAVERIQEVIGSLAAEGTNIILVEQNAGMALELADYAYVLDSGRIVQAGLPADLRGAEAVSAAYLGLGQRPHALGAPINEQDGLATDQSISPPYDSAQRKESTESALRVSDITVHYGGVTALDQIDIDVKTGSVHAIIGPNGAGKTTLFNVIFGLVELQAGRVEALGRDITNLETDSIIRTGLARTFQNLASYDKFTVEQNLLLGRHSHARTSWLLDGLQLKIGRDSLEVQLEKVRAIAESLGLENVLHAETGTLSYGQRKKVELARAICAEPEILLLDEPVAGLNDDESVEFGRQLLEIRDAMHLTLVVIEHDMRFVNSIADRITVVDSGSLITTGPPVEVYKDPRVLAAYLGDSYSPDT